MPMKLTFVFVVIYLK